MQCHQHKALRFQGVLSQGVQFQSSLLVPQQRVNHHIANKVDSFLSHAFAQQVVVGVSLRGEKQIGNGIGQHPIDLLRHRAVEGA